jgi:hypothetical protein
MYSTATHGPAELVQSQIKRTGGLAIIARVLVADRAVDLAIALSPSRLAVVRYVEEARLEDYAALATMVAEGDFVWAAIVSDGDEISDFEGRVARFGLGDLDRLTAHLLKLQEAHREAC